MLYSLPASVKQNAAAPWTDRMTIRAHRVSLMVLIKSSLNESKEHGGQKKGPGNEDGKHILFH